MPSNKKTYTVFFTLILLILVMLTLYFRWKGNSGNDWKTIIDGDAKGYYAYLKQIFITHDFGNAPVNYEQINEANGHSIIKYYSGTALLMSPFFLVSCAISWIGNLPFDAYGELFQKTISLAGILYLLMGLLFAGRLMQQLDIKLLNILLTLAIFLFGSNLLTYSILHPAMSHVYSFFAVSLFLWLFNSFLISGKKKFLLMSALALGLIYLIRPFNILIIGFLWFFITDLKSAYALLKQHGKTVLMAIGMFLLTISIQNILWFVQCGRFFIWSYHYEGFYLAHPEFFRLLFGFRKGLFLYTPLLGLSLLGLLLLLWKNRTRFIITSVFLLLIAWLLSAWWCWSYSDGFGMRPFIDFYIIFILLFALLLQNISKWLKWIIIALSLVLLALNLVQNYQYYKGIIHPEYMNRQRYQLVFLKTSDVYADCFGGADDLIPYNRYQQQTIIESPVFPDASAPDSANIIYMRGVNGKMYCYDERFEFNFKYTIQNSLPLYEANKTYALIHLKKMDLHPTRFHKNLFVISLSYKNKKNVVFRSFPLESYAYQSRGRWHEMTYAIMLPKIMQKDFVLNFYIWNRSLDIFLVKDIQIKVFKTA
jgi:hypothetical protein